MPIEVPRITVAIATPFTEQGEVDVDGIGRTASWLRSQGVGSIIPAGTTGEFAGMTAAERLTVLEATRQAAGNDCFLFANVSACAVGDVLELARQAAASPGKPDALLLLPPYYHRPFSADLGAEGCKQFFRAVLQGFAAANVTIPVFVYTFAVHTQQPVPPATFGALCAEFPQLAGIKASAVSVEEAQAYAAAAPGAAVLVGNGRANCASLRAGLNARRARGLESGGQEEGAALSARPRADRLGRLRRRELGARQAAPPRRGGRRVGRRRRAAGARGALARGGHGPPGRGARGQGGLLYH
eukprot:Transcript_25141.p2 GENE.Transcript_25141~~Transcript_25141.p2  ORF type:complete len:300 (-),score=65.78 Transcript_25141:289-1188(-)